VVKRKKTYQKYHKKKSLSLLQIGCFALLLGFLLVAALGTWSYQTYQREVKQADDARQAFIEAIVPVSQDLYQETGILPSITISQAILESDWGNSELAANYNNLFGIKAGLDQESVSLPTLEFENNEWITITADFRVYESWDESIRDHANTLVYGTTWNKDQYRALLDATDYIGQAKGLQQGGYATDPDYATKIIDLIRTHQLYQYD